MPESVRFKLETFVFSVTLPLPALILNDVAVIVPAPVIVPSPVDSRSTVPAPIAPPTIMLPPLVARVTAPVDAVIAPVDKSEVVLIVTSAPVAVAVPVRVFTYTLTDPAGALVDPLKFTLSAAANVPLLLPAVLMLIIPLGVKVEVGSKLMLPRLDCNAAPAAIVVVSVEPADVTVKSPVVAVTLPLNVVTPVADFSNTEPAVRVDPAAVVIVPWTLASAIVVRL